MPERKCCLHHQVGPTSVGGRRLTVPPTWPPGHLISLKFPSSIWVIVSSPFSWRGYPRIVHPICPVCLHHHLFKSYGNGGGEDILSCWWGLWVGDTGTGESPDVSDRLLSKVKGDVIKLCSELSGRGWQAQQSFNLLVILWKSCTRVFSLMRKALEVAMKDKRPSMSLPLRYLTGSKLLGARVLFSLHCHKVSMLHSSSCNFTLVTNHPLFMPRPFVWNRVL